MSKKELLHINELGVKIVKETNGEQSVVTVWGPEENDKITTYQFKNIELDYKTKYMSWANLDFCGGWEHREEDIIKQFKKDHKLFAQVVLDTTERDYKRLQDEMLHCIRTMNAKEFEYRKYYHGKTGDYVEHKECILVRDGCLSDYIDVEAVLNDYYKLGFRELEAKEKDLLMSMSDTPMWKFIKPEENCFGYNFRRSSSIVRTIFTGMLLGYPVESTIDRIYRALRAC